MNPFRFCLLTHPAHSLCRTLHIPIVRHIVYFLSLTIISPKITPTTLPPHTRFPPPTTPSPTMLRRKPTALTITSDDIAAFEEALAHQQAYTHYTRTGEDPSGLFTQPPRRQENAFVRPVSSGGGAVDPNDELKPLPGAKASIVRAKDERIVGSGTMSRAGAGRS
jgi:hypothetical protein